MSYDIYLRFEKCDRCQYRQESPELPNPTYNLTPIFDLALTGEPLPNSSVSEAGVVLLGEKTDRPRGLRILSGRKAADTTVAIRKALGHLGDPSKRAEFMALEPSNGWGTMDDAEYVFRKLLTAAEEYPEGVWDIG